MSINEAPTMVLLVGFVFLLMATIAYISYSYQESFPADETDTIYNETLTTVTENGEQVATIGACGFTDFTVATVQNSSGDPAEFPQTNFTSNSSGYVFFATGGNVSFNNTDWNVTYSYSFVGTACNITEGLTTELDDNTSIAGVILTISLVGIILSVLIGVFMMSRRRGL